MICSRNLLERFRSHLSWRRRKCRRSTCNYKSKQTVAAVPLRDDVHDDDGRVGERERWFGGIGGRLVKWLFPFSVGLRLNRKLEDKRRLSRKGPEERTKGIR